MAKTNKSKKAESPRTPKAQKNSGFMIINIAIIIATRPINVCHELRRCGHAGLCLSGTSVSAQTNSPRPKMMVGVICMA